MTRNRKLLLKVGLFGIQNLKRLAPIGDIGYLNATSFYCDYERSGLIKDIMRAFREQQAANGWKVHSGSTSWRCTDHWSECRELGLRWAVDSGD